MRTFRRFQRLLVFQPLLLKTLNRQLGLTLLLQQIRQLRLALLPVNVSISKLSLQCLQSCLGSGQCMFGFLDLLLNRSQSGFQLCGLLSRIFT